MKFKIQGITRLKKEFGKSAPKLIKKLSKHIKTNGISEELTMIPFEKTVRNKVVPIQCNFFLNGETSNETILLEYLESEKRTEECVTE